MLKIEHRIEPEFWKNYVKKHKKQMYRDLESTEDGRKVREKLREYMVKSQFYLCAYCCGRIWPNTALNEHIRPKGVPKYAKESMMFDNLIASCVSNSGDATCGTVKSDRYDEKKFISPLQDDCLGHFRFFPNGTMEGVTEQGEYTVELLNLNFYRLQQARKATYMSYENCDDSYIREFCLTPDSEGKLIPYMDIIRFFYDSSNKNGGATR